MPPLNYTLYQVPVALSKAIRRAVWIGVAWKNEAFINQPERRAAGLAVILASKTVQANIAKGGYWINVECVFGSFYCAESLLTLILLMYPVLLTSRNVNLRGNALTILSPSRTMPIRVIAFSERCISRTTHGT